MSTKVKVGIICLVLVLSIVGGSIAGAYFINRDDNSADKTPTTDNTDKTDNNNTSSGGSSSDTTSPVAARYIDEDGCGYQTIANVTYFFMSAKASDHQYYQYRTDNYLSVTVHFTPYGSGIPSYSTFSTNLKWSTDGLLWNDFEGELLNLDDPSIDYGVVTSVYDETVGDVVYVTFTQVTNCANPTAVLRDLKENVFDYVATDGTDEKMINCGVSINYKLPDGMEDLPG